MKLHGVLGVLLGLVLWTSASAAPITYQFDIHWTGGALAGTSDRGQVIIDNANCAGPCDGEFRPGDLASTLLGLTVEVAGQVFTALHDGEYPLFPVATFAAGTLVDLDFWASLGGFDLVLGMGLATHFRPEDSAGPDRSFGLITFLNRVPEPGTLALLSGALLAGTFVRRRNGRDRAA
jgi:hypothetical protein